MKNISGSQFLAYIAFLSITTLLQSCSKQEYFNIPKNADGTAYITAISSTTNTGITNLDDDFSVIATLPNAKSGDIMTTELLANQIPTGGSTYRLLPIPGTQKTVTVGSDLKATVTYTRQQALLVNVGDQVTVTYAGKTESALTSFNMTKATTVRGPLYAGAAVNIIRNAGAAYFEVAVAPKKAPYSGSVKVLNKNGINSTWSSSTYAYGTKIPISGDDFAIGKDTMYYAFVSTVNNYNDTLTQTVYVNPSIFQLTKSGTMVLGATTGGVNMLDNSTVAATNSTAFIAIDAASLQIHAGSALRAGSTISFVPSTSPVYSANNSQGIIAIFNAGTASATIDPIAGVPVSIFKIVDNANTYYGILKITSVVPGTSVAYEYKIGNTYAQLTVLK